MVPLIEPPTTCAYRAGADSRSNTENMKGIAARRPMRNRARMKDDKIFLQYLIGRRTEFRRLRNRNCDVADKRARALYRQQQRRGAANPVDISNFVLKSIFMVFRYKTQNPRGHRWRCVG